VERVCMLIPSVVIAPIAIGVLIALLL